MPRFHEPFWVFPAPNPYKVLGVEAGASVAEIDDAYAICSRLDHLYAIWMSDDLEMFKKQSDLIKECYPRLRSEAAERERQAAATPSQGIAENPPPDQQEAVASVVNNAAEAGERSSSGAGLPNERSTMTAEEEKIDNRRKKERRN